MKTRLLTFLAVLTLASMTALGQTEQTLQFDGLYVAKTGEVNIPNIKMEIYTYIKFYKDGTVYTQSVTSYDPKAVIQWFGKDGRFERKGAYEIDGVTISYTVTNDESPDKKIEGPKTDKYSGQMEDGNKLSLKVTYNNGDVKDLSFEFVKAEKK
jgi:hypothetical protein